MDLIERTEVKVRFGEKDVYIARDHIITSLGFTTSENMQQMEKGRTGLRMIHDDTLYPNTLPLSLVDTATLEERFQAVLDLNGLDTDPEAYTRLEKLFIVSIQQALHNLPYNLRGKKTLLVISTTKGNIELLEEADKSRFNHKRLFLWEMGRIIREFFGFANPPLIISNACISGIMAIMTATRYLQSGMYDYAVVAGGDIISEFVISGFQSFQSLSPTPCKPYDAARDGLSLGEGCGTIVLTTDTESYTPFPIKITGASITNDANHISGPSRTGEELSLAIQRTLSEAGVTPAEVDYINAHGTATPFNDEMEAKAFALAGLSGIPLNSLKGYWGHTLGAAGIIESVATIRAMINHTLIQSAGFETLGVSRPVNVIEKTTAKEIRTSLKTGSGFGGCNAAIMFQKG